MSLTLQKKQTLDRALLHARNDYASYVETASLFNCQKPAEALVNDDELAFQTVHQVAELWMKLRAGMQSAALTADANPVAKSWRSYC